MKLNFGTFVEKTNKTIGFIAGVAIGIAVIMTAAVSIKHSVDELSHRRKSSVYVFDLTHSEDDKSLKGMREEEQTDEEEGISEHNEEPSPKKPNQTKPKKK